MSYNCPLKLANPLTKVDSHRYSNDNNNFARSMRLSQDGFKILSIMEDRSLKLSRLSFEKYNRYSYYTMGDTQDETMGDGLPFIKPSVEAKLGESIYDAQWLPLNQNPSNNRRGE